MAEQLQLRVDLDAPIIPGESAAGMRLGHKVAEYGDRHGAEFRVEQPESRFVEREGRRVLRSDNVSVWAYWEVITQIGVHGHYRGAVNDRIRLGDTVEELAAEFGPVGEDEEDNLVAAGLPGMCFEVPCAPFQNRDLESYSRQWLDQVRDSPISECYVYSPRCVCGSDLRSRPDLAHCPGCGQIVFEPLEL